MTENLIFTQIKIKQKTCKIKYIAQHTMNTICKGLIAGYGANKLGNGCCGTVIVFVIIWFLLHLFSL